jgi:hypothetical protein
LRSSMEFSEPFSPAEACWLGLHEIRKKIFSAFGVSLFTEIRWIPYPVARLLQQTSAKTICTRLYCGYLQDQVLQS